MTLVDLRLQPLDYVKGYAEALNEVKVLDDTEADIYTALHLCLFKADEARKYAGWAPTADVREQGLGEGQASIECAEAYRQLREIKGWDSAPSLGDFIGWRLTLAQGLIDKAKP